MGDGQDIIKDFLVESYENLDTLDREFVALEKEPENKEKLSGIFRTIHTIKGTCGFLGFSKLESVAHSGETLLSRMREGQLRLDSDITTGLLQMVDAVREMLASIESAQNEGDADYLELITRLTALSKGSAAPVTTPTPVAAAKVTALPLPPIEPVAPGDEMLDPIEAMLAEEIRKSNANLIAHAASEKQANATPQTPAAPPVEIHSAPAESIAEVHEGKANTLAENNVRVDVSLLDRLMNLVGELVLARNQVLTYSTKAQNSELVGTSQHLDLITSELQEAVMKTRMQPIGNVWNKLPRVVRDLSKSCGKKIRLEMEGQDTELDKTILEAIKDPLTHIVRNSVDHGVELPEARAKAGKPNEGCLKLRAFHEGGQVNIEITDDGGGIRVDRVKKKALEKGLITPDEATRMTDREAFQLVFKPGFSTAEKITNVSGRGVGMDVVKTNIEKIGGTVDIQSVAGQGTTLRIKIPLTLAIIPALIVTSGTERFAIPQVSLLEIVRLQTEDAENKVEMVHGTPIYRLRGSLLPLIHLGEQLKLKSDNSDDKRSHIVVLQADENKFGLVVDRIEDASEIVVKPLGKAFKGMNTFAGATVLGDGRVALILDIMGLAKRAHLHAAHSGHSAATVAADTSRKQSMLVFSTQHHARMAIPLSQVARLEQIPRDLVETSGSQRVVQYRGRIMPLVYVDECVPGLADTAAAANLEPQSDDLDVIVHTNGNRAYGLVVHAICDIVKSELDIQPVSERPGVRGSAVIAGRVTELVDIDVLIGTSAEAAITANSNGHAMAAQGATHE